MPTPPPLAPARGRSAPVTGRIGLPLLLALALLAAFAPIATDLYLPGFPDIAEDLSTTASGVQLTLTTFLAGLVLGQLVTGPLSDRYGRKGPLLVSASVCVAAGVVTAIAPNVLVLVAARLVQGLSGAGGMVIGRAVIADVVTGRAAAKAFTLMITVGGVAPVVAPMVGGLLVGPVGWRGMMWAVTALCAAMLLAAVFVVPETLPRESRRHAGTGFLAAVRQVLASLRFRCYLAVFAFGFGTMMAYISSSPFVYQNVVGLSEIGYAAAFGLNAAGLISAGWVASRLVDRVDPRRMVEACLAAQVLAGTAFVLLVAMGAPTWTFPVAIFLTVACNGGVMGNSAALAMGEVRQVAGTGSAVLGFGQFALGALVSPLVGLGGEASALVPAVVMVTCSVLGGAGCLLARRT